MISIRTESHKVNIKGWLFSSFPEHVSKESLFIAVFYRQGNKSIKNITDENYVFHKLFTKINVNNWEMQYVIIVVKCFLTHRLNSIRCFSWQMVKGQIIVGKLSGSQWFPVWHEGIPAYERYEQFFSQRERAKHDKYSLLRVGCDGSEGGRAAGSFRGWRRCYGSIPRVQSLSVN